MLVAAGNDSGEEPIWYTGWAPAKAALHALFAPGCYLAHRVQSLPSSAQEGTLEDGGSRGTSGFLPDQLQSWDIQSSLSFETQFLRPLAPVCVGGKEAPG